MKNGVDLEEALHLLNHAMKHNLLDFEGTLFHLYRVKRLFEAPGAPHEYFSNGIKWYPAGIENLIKYYEEKKRMFQ
jgi:hypothetical protein